METRKSALGKVIALYREVKHNLKTARSLGYQRGMKLFRTGVWEVQKHNLTFLPEDLKTEISALYEELYRINDEIQASVEGKREHFLMSVNTDRVTGPLQSITLKLDQWLAKNADNPQYAPKRPGFWWF